MRLIDMLAGAPGNDGPKDNLSGVKLVVEPSIGLLEIIDDFRARGGETREAALLACAALGAVSKKVVGGIFDALTGGRGSKPSSGDELAAEKAELDAKQLVLTKALAKKEALEEAARACDEVAKSVENWTLDENNQDSSSHVDVAVSCAHAVMELMVRVVEEVDEAFKKLPAPSPDFKRVVGSAAQRECHYSHMEGRDGRDCRKVLTHEIDWSKWCASCVCRHALPEIWGSA